MSDKSPLFVSANELLAHSIELYTSGNERKYKFVILHLANAIELILKDRVIDLGTSIYKGQSTQTIGIWDALSTLDRAGIAVPERPIIELLVDDRNTIQHRFGFPNADAVFYYLDHVLRFFRRFLRDEYSVDVVEVMRIYVPDDALATVGLIEKDDESAPLDKLFQLSPESAVLQAFSLVEQKALDAIFPERSDREHLTPAWSSRELLRVLDQLVAHGFGDSNLLRDFQELRMMRNRAAHVAHFADEVQREEWAEALEKARRVIAAVDAASERGYFDEVRAELLARVRESPYRIRPSVQRNNNAQSSLLSDNATQSQADNVT